MHKIGVTIGGRTYEIQVEAAVQSNTDLRVIVDGKTIPVSVQSLRDPESLDWILVGNRPYEIVLDRDLQWLEVYGRRYGDLTVSDLEAAVARPTRRDGHSGGCDSAGGPCHAARGGPRRPARGA